MMQAQRTKVKNPNIHVSKLKEEREAKRSHLDDRHFYLLHLVAEAIGYEKSDVEDVILDGNQVEIIDRFFEINGICRLFFFYQEPEVEKDSEVFKGPVVSFSENGKSVGKIGRKPKLLVNDEGEGFSNQGLCLAFTRNRNTTRITGTNISEEVAFTMLDPGGENQQCGLLNAVQTLMTNVFMPSLQTMEPCWGVLNKPDGKATKQAFLESLDSFVLALAAAKESMDQVLTLAPCESCNLSSLKSVQDFQSFASHSENLQKVEDCVAVWIKQIEQILAESEQMRREADNIGPRAEIDYWKKRLAKFNFLLDQIESSNVKSAMHVLQAAKSKTLAIWQKLDGRITDTVNEAKDNIKFLETLEKLCDPLYNSDPVGMLDGVSSLLNAVRMIHSISRYYNTSERLTSLFVKITNQMVTACKSYITNGGKDTVWSIPSNQMISKLKDCIRLNDEYQRCFQNSKTRFQLATNEAKFEFSEMYIFGKFEALCRRLNKVTDLFETVELYSHLLDTKIEGIETFASSFNTIQLAMRKKTYDILDQRKLDFDDDYDLFKKQISDLHDGIVAYVDGQLSTLKSTKRSLHLLYRFEGLGLPQLGIEEKYQKIVLLYLQELDTIFRLYQKYKADPPIARNLPPIAGRITWARQMYGRINDAMEAFQRKPCVLKTSDGRKAIKNYNKLAKVLTEYEVLYQRCWLTQIEVVKSGLSATLLVRNSETEELFINFDPQILTLLKETECMVHLGLDIPPVAAQLWKKQNYFKEVFDSLTMVLRENKSIRSRIPSLFDQLMNPHIKIVDAAFFPGWSKLTWLSIGIEQFIANVKEKLRDLNLLVSRVMDLIEFRINAILRDISSIVLCELPTEEPWTTDYFLERKKKKVPTATLP